MSARCCGVLLRAGFVGGLNGSCAALEAGSASAPSANAVQPRIVHRLMPMRPPRRCRTSGGVYGHSRAHATGSGIPEAPAVWTPWSRRPGARLATGRGRTATVRARGTDGSASSERRRVRPHRGTGCAERGKSHSFALRRQAGLQTARTDVMIRSFKTFVGRYVPGRVTAIVMVALAAALQPVDASAQATAANRPRIGVALGGGSARGLAHVGVLRWLEEHHI